jgi:hypothetical protein
MARLWVAVAFGLLVAAVGARTQGQTLGTERDPWKQGLNSQPLAQASVQTSRRSALVIGNGAYAKEPLVNGVNDAEAVARTLEEIGFKVSLLRNADKRSINEAVEEFSRRLGQGDIGLFYFSGHGVQVDGENYLVPINAQLNRQADAQYDAVPLGKVISAMEATSANAKIIILDACRDNPFYRRWTASTRGSVTRGLATPLTSGRGTLIAFSTSPGKVAADGIGNSPNSPFTSHLLRHLRTPNLEVGQLFRRVRGDMVQATRNEQIPWVSEALVGEVYLNPLNATSDTVQEYGNKALNALVLGRDERRTISGSSPSSTAVRSVELAQSAFNAWNLYTETGYETSGFSVKKNGFSIKVISGTPRSGEIPWGIQIASTSPLQLQKGRKYKLRFKFSSSSDLDLVLRLGEHAFPKSIFKDILFRANEKNKPTLVEYSFTANEYAGSSVLYFQLGNAATGSTIQVTDVAVVEVL